MSKELIHIDEQFSLIMNESSSLLGIISNKTYSGNIIKESTKYLCKFPNVESVAFLKMNHDNFEFNLNFNYPKESNKLYRESLQFCLDSGSVGLAVQTGRYSLCEMKEFKVWNLFLPLISTQKVVGVFILTSKSDFNVITLNYINLLNMFCNSLANILENKELYLKQKQTKELLDQLIASRTMELVENNKALGDKIESLKSNLSMSIPHEVRTPINEILGMTNYLNSFITQSNGIKDTDRNDVLEIIADINTSANRLRNLFENFIYHTRLSIISTSLKEIEKLQTQISPYCDSIIFEQTQIKAMAYERVDDISINLVSATILMGEEYLAKLVDELVDNALKYSEKGTKIDIYSSIEGEFYKLTIHDLGAGIPDEFLNQIDAYVQFERNKHEQQGLGLGLAIAYKIVDLHNGKILIESELNKFTKVIVKVRTTNSFILD
ncbi:MAG: HAMP domain-containing histidine kinase [Candidatus Kapabacteria bacterium]|nr:HAMP domain-containing histidine kinase [Ignavibacteriota bacterium]MCW5883352.1 HAMP domain-containing histidine kinase [Candidatus Kapabacteria bacterium]